MANKRHNSYLSRWKLTYGNKAAEKVHLNDFDITQWRKRVEMASEFAVSEVFSHKKSHIGPPDLAVPLQSCAQLKDHDDAYSEAQALLGDWLHTKLRLELEMDEDDLIFPAEKSSPLALDISTSTPPDYNNFDDMYNSLMKEEENSTIDNFLQELREQEVLDSAMMDHLAMDAGQIRKKFRNPALTMEARHKQVRENKARREAERRRLQKERETVQEAREEARRRERELERRRRQEAHRQEGMLQQEVVRLRRQMDERRCAQQLARRRERERTEKADAKSPQYAPLIPTAPQKQDQQQIQKEQQVQTLIYMQEFMCLQRHFTGWFSVVVNQRIRMGKAKTVCEWRRKLKVWRGWRKLVWQKQQEREVEKTELELRAENRGYLLAVQSDKRRLLRRCLSEWQVWVQMEREQRNFLSRQQETRRKMAALLSRATSGKLRITQNPACQAILAPAETATQSQTVHKESEVAEALVHQETSPGSSVAPVAPVAPPTEPWQINRRHVALTGAEVRRALHKNPVTPGARFEHRNATQQQIISQQRKLLKEQQEQIARLKTEQHFMGLELDVQKTALSIQLDSESGARPRIHKSQPTEKRAAEVNTQHNSPSGLQKKNVTRPNPPHPIITAMEARARQRAERRKEVEEVKRRKEEEKLAEMKAAEEQRQQEEDEERRRAADRRREERRLEREREEEKQRQLQRQQEQMRRACQHYHTTLLRGRGLGPWTRLLQLTQANLQLAQSHHSLSLLRRCLLHWHQAAREAQSRREASADRLHQHFLLGRSLSCWKRIMDWRMLQEDRAERFHRAHTLRKALLALQHLLTRERRLEWDRLERAEQHNSRRVLQRWFLVWKHLPFLLQREREKEQRREVLLQKVAEVLPDFCLHLS